MSLKEYQRKRKFQKTPEPAGKTKKKSQSKGHLRFLVQMHAATRLHYDFRIECGGVLLSWAVPKGPSLNPLDQRLAVHVEDHPLEYGNFEGVIPKGNYGAGTVLLWDTGTYLERSSKDIKESEKKVREGLEKGRITIVLQGKRLNGEFALIKLKRGDPKSWMLLKKKDAQAVYRPMQYEAVSVVSGRTMEEITKNAPSKGEVWYSKKVAGVKPKKRAEAPRKKFKAKKPNKENLPRKNKVMLSTASAHPPEGKGWIFESFGKGTRTIAEVEKGNAKLFSKQGLSFDKKFPKVAQALKGMRPNMVLDGEVADGVYRVRDLLHLDGWNLRGQPLKDRKKKLKALKIFGPHLSYVEDHAKLSAVDAEGGIEARYGDSPYMAGVSKDWLKLDALPVEENRPPRLTHIDKVFFPKEKITKGDVIEYYRSVADYILPHLKDRPESLNRHPNGIDEKGFFQKDVAGYVPPWVQREAIYSESGQKSVQYLLCQNEWTLLYMANLGCIEINPWLSRIQHLDRPDYCVIDLDPDDNSFSEVVEVALAVHEFLDRLKIKNYCKTSGASGLHVCVPLQANVDFETSKTFAQLVVNEIHKDFPKNTSVERSPSKRRGKIYLDFLQNRRGQTLAAPYCLRPRDGATASAPLRWKEVNKKLRPDQFHLRNMLDRIKDVGELWAPLLKEKVDIQAAIAKLSRSHK